MGTSSFSRRARRASLFLFAVLTLSLSVGCATTTTIVTDPPGATVSRDGVALGQTPYVYSTTMSVLESETVQVTAPSGQTATVVLRRSEIDPLPFFGTLGACFFCGWTVVGLGGGVLYFFSGWKLPDTTVVTFQPQHAALRPRAPALARKSDDDEDERGDGRVPAMGY